MVTFSKFINLFSFILSIISFIACTDTIKDLFIF